MSWYNRCTARITASKSQSSDAHQTAGTAIYVEQADENRYTYGIREWYALRKETIERDFALAKELHGFRYTQMYGKARMETKSALTFACVNLKKQAKRRWKDPVRVFCPIYTANPAFASA